MATTYANMTTTSSLDDSRYSAYIQQVAFMALMDHSVMLPLVREESLVGKATLSMDFRFWPTVTINTPAENVTEEPQQITDSKTTITASEKAATIMASDISDEASVIDANPDTYAKILGTAGASDMDVRLAALFTNLNDGTAAGTSGSLCDLDDILTAVSIIEVNKADTRGEMVGVLGNFQVHNLRKDVLTQTGTPFGNVKPQDVSNYGTGFKFRVYEVNFYGTGNTPTGATATDEVGAIFIKNHTIGLTTLRAGRIETQRNAKGRGLDIVWSAVYGVGEIEDDAGVPIITKAARS